MPCRWSKKGGQIARNFLIRLTFSFFGFPHGIWKLSNQEMKNIKILFFLLIFPSPLLVLGQSKIPINKLVSLVEAGKTTEALALSNQLLKSNPNDPVILHWIGKIHHNDRNFKIAEVYLAQAIEKSSNPIDDLYFDMAENAQIGHQFDDAIEYYEKISPKYSGYKQIAKRIKQCKIGIEMVKKPLDVKITNLGKTINTKANEFRPLLSSDEVQMFFTRSEENSFSPFNPDRNQIFQTFNTGTWETANPLPKPINSSSGEIGLALSGDGTELTLMKMGKSLDLLSSEFKDNRWSTPKPLIFNSVKNETSICYSVHRKKAFFVSNRNGNKDIFTSRKNEKGVWSKPTPLGKNINTNEDEESPWLDSDGKYLYFSSKGHESMGGFDIFKVAIDDPNAIPQNLGFPINSTSDDLFYTTLPDGKTAYYSSLREGGFGGSDIYQIRFGGSKTRLNNLFKGTISDLLGQPIDAQITITDPETKQVVAKIKAHPETGTFVTTLQSGKTYSILGEKVGYLFYSDFINFADDDQPKDVIRDIRMQKLQGGVVLVLNNIFFDPGKSSLKKESTQELQRLLMILRHNPGLKVEISAHLEPGGPEDDGNLKLSENRAQAVVDYLVATGIKSSRLIAKGYGSTKPLAETPEDTRQNRRCELKILTGL